MQSYDTYQKYLMGNKPAVGGNKPAVRITKNLSGSKRKRTRQNTNVNDPKDATGVPWGSAFVMEHKTGSKTPSQTTTTTSSISTGTLLLPTTEGKNIDKNTDGRNEIKQQQQQQRRRVAFQPTPKLVLDEVEEANREYNELLDHTHTEGLDLSTIDTMFNGKTTVAKHLYSDFKTDYATLEEKKHFTAIESGEYRKVAEEKINIIKKTVALKKKKRESKIGDNVNEIQQTDFALRSGMIYYKNISTKTNTDRNSILYKRFKPYANPYRLANALLEIDDDIVVVKGNYYSFLWFNPGSNIKIRYIVCAHGDIDTIHNGINNDNGNAEMTRLKNFNYSCLKQEIFISLLSPLYGVTFNSATELNDRIMAYSGWELKRIFEEEYQLVRFKQKKKKKSNGRQQQQQQIHSPLDEPCNILMGASKFEKYDTELDIIVTLFVFYQFIPDVKREERMAKLALTSAITEEEAFESISRSSKISLLPHESVFPTLIIVV